jgi:hypothetical protein
MATEDERGRTMQSGSFADRVCKKPLPVGVFRLREKVYLYT